MTKINESKSSAVTYITKPIIAKYYINIFNGVFILETRFSTVNLGKDLLKSTCKTYGEKWIFAVHTMVVSIIVKTAFSQFFVGLFPWKTYNFYQNSSHIQKNHLQENNKYFLYSYIAKIRFYVYQRKHDRYVFNNLICFFAYSSLEIFVN